MKYDLEQVRIHLELLTGEKNPNTSFQLYFDPKGVPAPKGLAVDFHNTFEENQDYFQKMQDLHCGIYVSVNQTDGIKRKEENIIKNRFFVADWDGVTPPPLNLPPTFTCKRDDTHVHAYWKISDEVSNEEWSVIQKKISLFYGSDSQIINPSQVLRLCGSVHYKNPESPQMYQIDEINAEASYTASEMTNSMPFTPVQDALLDRFIKTKDGIENGSGYDRSERYESLFVKWLKDIAPIAVQGDGTKTLIKVACWAKDRGIFLNIAQELMWEHYNQRCEPVWDKEEQWHFNQTIRNGYTYSTSDEGCKTAIGGFSNREPLPERTDGYVDKPKELKLSTEKLELPELHEVSTENKRDFARVSREEAQLMETSLTDKSPDYDLAVYFDGLIFDGKEIYRCNKVFYVYNGKTYDEVGDDVIKAKVQQILYKIKPANSKVRSVFESMCDLCNKPNLENGMWLDGCGRDSKNISVYDNGLVDLTQDNLTLEPHTYTYFSFSKKEYSYNPNALCPTWDKFLKDIFESDPDRAKLLLEFIGLCLVHEIKFQKFLFLLGVSRGGKGVITNTIRNIIGKDNCANPSLEKISTDHMLFSIHDKAVAFFDDVRSVSINNRESSLSTVLQITGGDPQTFNRKWKPPMTCIMTPRFIMSANVPPDFIDASGALVARMLVIKFDKSFRGKEDLNLGSKISEELSGISNQAISAYREMLKRGKFTEPESSIAEKQEMKDEMFPLSGFVNDCCKCKEDSTTSVNDLFKAYLLHCSLNSIKMNMTKVKFSKCLKNSDLMLNMKRRMVDNIKENYFTGITLNDRTFDSINVDNVSQFPNRGAK
jgi:putative DNA primase/helicase